MSEFLRELGYAPAFYWIVAGFSLLVWLVATASLSAPAGHWASRLSQPWIFSGTLLLALFAWRWPGIFFYRPVNPDESQFLAGALSIVRRGDPWWPDAMTSGPLVMLPLTVPALVGLPVDFPAGRVIAVLLNWGTLMLTFLSLRHLLGERPARLLMLPLSCFWIFLYFWDFAPYCSELAPIFLCSFALWLSVTAFGTDGAATHSGKLILTGLILGVTPFSKLQIITIAGAIGLSTLIWVWWQPTPARQRVRQLTCVLMAAFAGFGLMLASLWLSGNLPSVYQSYLLHNVHYAQGRAVPWLESSYLLRYLTETAWGFGSFHWPMLALLIFAQLRLRPTPWRPLLLGWLLLAGAYLAVLAPGRLYPHYLLLLTLPLAFLVSLLFGYALQARTRSRRLRTALWATFIIVGAGAQLVDRLSDRHSLQKLLPVRSERTIAADFINRAKQPGDLLTVWGWRPELYVETQLPQATREALTEAQLEADPQHEYFRARFMGELRASRPAFFVDTVGPADFILKDLTRQGHHAIPALREYISENYALVSREAPVRVYVRRDLLDR